MKHTFAVLCILLFSALLSLSHLFGVFRKHLDAAQDNSFTTLVEVLPIPMFQGKPIVSGNKTILTFVAGYDNLGTIAIRFLKPKAYTDTVFFRIKESKSNTWQYEQTYQAHTFNEFQYFPFGFPVIPDSKNHQFDFEVESASGNADAHLSFHPSSGQILAKYVFPKAYLFRNPDSLAQFLKERIGIYLSYIPAYDFLFAVFLFFVPILTTQLLLSLWQISKRLDTHTVFIRVMQYAAPIILFLITVTVLGYFSSIGADAHHDGTIFKPAMDVAGGSMLYRDTFFFYGALVPIIQATALLLFGKYLLTLKLLTVFFYGCNVILGYVIARKFLPIMISFAISLIWIFMTPYFFHVIYNWTTIWSSVYAIFFQLLTAYVLIRYLETGHTRYVVISGGMAALTFWCRQTVGVFLFLAVLSFYPILFFVHTISKPQLIKLLKLTILGFSVVCAVFLIWIFANHALNDWWRQSVFRGILWSRAAGNGYQITGIVKAFFAPSESILSVWTILPVTTFLVGIQSLLTIRKAKNQFQNKSVLVLSLIGLASWTQYFPYNDAAHAFWGATPMFLLFAIFIYRFVRDFLVPRGTIPALPLKFICVALMVLVFLPDMALRAGETKKKIQEPYYVLSEPAVLKNIRLTKEERDWYQYVYRHIQEYFRKEPNGNVIINGPDALYLTFDPRIKNYQPVYMNWWLDAVYPEYEPNKDAYIKNKQPFLISYFEFLPEGYCRVDSFVRFDSMFLATPCHLLSAE